MIKKAAITGAAAAAALTVGIGPASATFVTGGLNFIATPKGGDLVLTAGVSMHCTSGTAAGTVNSG